MLTRKRLVSLGVVAAFVAVFAAVGAVSRSSPTAASAGATTGTAPTAQWYWTMAVSPTDPNVLLLGTSSGAFRSSDGGKSWKAVGPAHLNATSLAVAGSSVFLGGGTIAANASPVMKNGAGRSASTGGDIVAVSSDGGATWQQLQPKGLPNATVQALAVDPTRSTVVYALLDNGRLYRSGDGAHSFTLVSSHVGIPPWALAVTGAGHLVAGDMDTGAYQSQTGKTWQRVAFTDPRGGRMVMEYAPAPGNPSHVLMTSYGVLSSSDGGKSWHVALKSDVMFGPVAWSTSASGVAYAVGFDGSVWRSADGGTTWAKVS